MVFFRAHDLPQEAFDDIIHKPKWIYVHEEHMKPLMVDSTDYCAEEQRSEPLHTIKSYSHRNHVYCSLRSLTFPHPPVVFISGGLAKSSLLGTAGMKAACYLPRLQSHRRETAF